MRNSVAGLLIAGSAIAGLFGIQAAWSFIDHTLIKVTTIEQWLNDAGHISPLAADFTLAIKIAEEKGITSRECQKVNHLWQNGWGAYRQAGPHSQTIEGAGNITLQVPIGTGSQHDGAIVTLADLIGRELMEPITIVVTQHDNYVSPWVTHTAKELTDLCPEVTWGT